MSIRPGEDGGDFSIRAASSGEGQSKVASVQALRGVAACSVAAMHCVSAKLPLATAGDAVLFEVTRVLQSFGGAGVDIFFVISGFIIMLITDRPRRVQRSWKAAASFLTRRVARIYPLYWITLGVLLVLSVWAGGRLDPHATKLPVFLLTTTHIPLQNPAWSLPFELWFYAGTAVGLFVFPRSFRTGVASWFVLQTAFLIWHDWTGLGPHWAVLARPQVLEFFFGCAAAVVIQARLPHMAACLLLLASMALFTVGSAICYARLPSGSLYDGERVFYWGVSACLAMVPLISLERAGQVTPPEWLCRLGDISYSIYLWHAPLMALSFLICFKSGIAVPLLFRAALEFACTLLIAGLSFRVIERPLIDVVRSLTVRSSPAA